MKAGCQWYEPVQWREVCLLCVDVTNKMLLVLLATVIASLVHHHSASSLLVVALCNSSRSADHTLALTAPSFFDNGAASVINPSSN